MADPNQLASNPDSVPTSASTTTARKLHQLHAAYFKPGADWTKIIFFLQEIAQFGLKPGKEYHLPDLVNKIGEKTKYRSQIPLINYLNGYPDLLLPADVINFLWQINDYYQSINSAYSSPKLLNLTNFLTSRGYVQRDKEIELAKELSIKESQELALGFLQSYDELTSSSSGQTPESTIPGQTSQSSSSQISLSKSELPTAGAKNSASDQTSTDIIPDEEFSLVDSQTQTTITSLTILSLNAVFKIYHPDLNLDDLPPELREAFFKQLRPKIENLILGLSVEDQQKFLGTEGDFATRLKILQQAFQYLIATPASQFLLKTAVDYYYTKNGLDPKNLATARSGEFIAHQLQQTAEDNNLFQNFVFTFDSRDATTQLAQKLSKLLSVETGDLTVVIENFRHNITSLIISNPLLTPQFLNYLTPSQLQAIFNYSFPAQIWKNAQNQANLIQLLRDYWLIYRAELTKNHPEIFVYYQEQTDEQLKKAAQPPQFYQQLKTMSGVRAIGQSLNNDDQKTIEAFTGKKEDQEQLGIVKAQVELYWKQLDEAKKQAYLQLTYGAELEILKTKKDYEKQVVAEFNYFQYLNASVATEAATQPTDFQSIPVFTEGALAGPDFSENFSTVTEDQIGDRINQSIKFGAKAADTAAEGIGNLSEKLILPLLDSQTGGAASQIWDLVPEEYRKKVDKALGYGILGAAGTYGLTKYLQHISPTANFFGFLGRLGGPLLEIPATLGGFALECWGKNALNSINPQNWWPKSSSNAANPVLQPSTSFSTNPLVTPPPTAPAASSIPPPPISTGQSAITPSSLLPKPNLAPTIKHLGFAHPWYQNPFTVSIATTTGTAVLGFGLISTILHSAFLTNFGGTGLYVTPDSTTESKYVTVKKIAQTGCEDNICPEPEFPMEVTYEITIQPKDQYSITITGISDELKVLHNQEKYAELGKAVPTIPIQTKTLADFNLTNDQLIIEPTEEPLTLTYTITLTSDYNHALIRNRFKLSFNHLSPDAGSGTDEIVAVETIRLGDYPEGHICWPSSGIRLTQQPYTVYELCDTHRNSDAYDISNYEGTAIYAVIDGQLCAGHYSANIDVGYGLHETLTGAIDGETYEFIYAHLLRGSAVVTGTQCIEVQEGEKIGEIDDTGNSDGNHLHFELRAGHNNTYTLTDLLNEGDLEPGEYFPLGYEPHTCYE